MQDEQIYCEFRPCLDSIPGRQSVFKMLVATDATMRMSSLNIFPASNYEPGWPVMVIPIDRSPCPFNVSYRPRFLRTLPRVVRWIQAFKSWSTTVLGEYFLCVFARLDDALLLLVYLRLLATGVPEEHDDAMDEGNDAETQEPQSLPPMSPASDQTGHNGIDVEESLSASEWQPRPSQSAAASRELMDLFEGVGQLQQRARDPGPPRRYPLRDDVQRDF